MKAVKIRIRRGDKSKGEDAMLYPARYNPYEVDANGYATPTVGGRCALSGGLARGEDEEWGIVVLKDELADEYALDPDMEIVSESVADALMEQWRVDKGLTEEVVRDPVRLTAIRAKQEAGLALSAEDLKALDPDDETPGINKRLRPIRRLLRVEKQGAHQLP